MEFMLQFTTFRDVKMKQVQSEFLLTNVSFFAAEEDLS
jgi:hypothetical protein